MVSAYVVDVSASIVPAVVKVTPVAAPLRATANSEDPPAGVEDWIATDVGVLVRV